MIGYHITNNGIANSKGQATAGGDYITWLLQDHPGDSKVLYDLDAAVASLARLLMLSKEDIEKLAGTGKLKLDAQRRLRYYADRMLIIEEGYGPGHPTVKFINAGQYIDVHYTADDSLEHAAELARTAEATGAAVLAAMKELGISDADIISPINAFIKKYDYSRPGRDDYMFIPNFMAVPDEAVEVLDLAHRSVKGNWLEATQRGYWEYAYDYDISGAYASELAKLLDIRRGRWVCAPTIPDGAVYGWAEGLITTDAPFHPFVWREPGASDEPVQVTLTPTGSWSRVATLQELQLMQEFPQLGSFKICRGYWWIPDPNRQQFEFLKGPINWLWGKRKSFQAADNEIGNKIVKRILAGLWGKMLQVTKDAGGNEMLGDYNNAVYASLVEVNTRITVVRTALREGIIPLHVAVDGMITDRPLVNTPLGRELGQWRLSHEGGCIIASCGVVGFEGKAGAEEFALKYEWLKSEIEAHPKRKEYSMDKLSPRTISRAMGAKFEHLGEIETVTRTITIPEDFKRMWKTKPRTGGDLLKNKYIGSPWSINMISAGPAGGKV